MIPSKYILIEKSSYFYLHTRMWKVERIEIVYVGKHNNTDLDNKYYMTLVPIITRNSVS